MLINFNHLKTFYNALVHKMKAFRGNWNQNDPTADDYIKNRPFYDESKITTVLPKTTVNVEYAYDSVYNPFKIKLEDGKTYTVIFDGSTYISVAKSTYDNEPFIGNSSILGWNDNVNTGEPFFIDVYNNEQVTFATTTPGKHTISVVWINEVIRKLDKKYLPDDIIDTTLIDELGDKVESLEAIDHEAYIGADNALRNELIGTTSDASTVNTIYGAKKYAEEATATLVGIDIEDIDDICLTMAGGLYQSGAIALYNSGGQEAIADMKTESWDNLVKSSKILMIDDNKSFAAYKHGELRPELVLPTNSSITYISEGALDGCHNLKAISVPNNITSIGASAFSNCTNLISVNIPTGIESIENSTFYNCYNLPSITIPESIENIGSDAFYNCRNINDIYYDGTIEQWCNIWFTNLNSIPGYSKTGSVWHMKNIDRSNVIIPSTISRIRQYVFYKWEDMQSVIIPDSITAIDKSSFAYSGLTSINIPGSVVDIGTEAFSNCRSCSSLNIAEGVQIIGVRAFQYCDKLTSLTIPASITQIGAYAFRFCSALKDCYYAGTIEQWNAVQKGISWRDSTDITTIICSDGTVTL